jgi:hypothetical protein
VATVTFQWATETSMPEKKYFKFKIESKVPVCSEGIIPTDSIYHVYGVDVACATEVLIRLCVPILLV